jgi:hypothetical protein
MTSSRDGESATESVFDSAITASADIETESTSIPAAVDAKQVRKNLFVINS